MSKVRMYSRAKRICKFHGSLEADDSGSWPGRNKALAGSKEKARELAGEVR